MKNLEEVKKELEKINKEDETTPIFDFDNNEIYYRLVNKREKTNFIEFEARQYIMIHYMAIEQRKYWNKYEFPLDKFLTRYDWENRNTENWYKYEEIMNNFNADSRILDKEYNKIRNEWFKD